MTDKKTPQRIEYFWLCDACSSEMTLMPSGEGGIVLKPLPTQVMDVAS